MPQVIFWDVDTQNDFIQPDGKLYVSGAEAILPNLQRLTQHARSAGIRIFGSVDAHRPDDPELSPDPDFQETFPPHCLEGTHGQEKVSETLPRNPLWIDPDPQSTDSLQEAVLGHAGEVIFRKRRFDVFTNPNLDPVIEAVAPDLIVLYGVALDVCDAHAIEGFLERETAALKLVIDATRAIDPQRGEVLVAAWKQRGVEVVTTHEVCG